MTAVITLVPVVSSNIAAIGYHAPSRTLRVQFASGAVYDYANVMVPDHDALIHADSIGGWFAKKIKALPETFPCTKVNGPTAPGVIPGSVADPIGARIHAEAVERRDADVSRFDAVADVLVREAAEFAEQAREHRRLGRYHSAHTQAGAVRGIAVKLLASDLDPATWLGAMRALLQELATWT